MTNNIRKIGKLGESIYVILPKEWGKAEEFVRYEIVNENKILLTKIEIVEKKTSENYNI